MNPERREALGVHVRSGRGGIRTHGTLSRTHTFQACALNHSATRPTFGCRPTTPSALAARSPSQRADVVRRSSGQGEIRTHGTVAGTPVFETGAFNHSATCPVQPKNLARGWRGVNETGASPLREELAEQRTAFELQ